MNLSSDIKAIEQAATRIDNTRAKILGQAGEIRKAIALIQATSDDALYQGPAISILEDAAAVIESELFTHARAR